MNGLVLVATDRTRDCEGINNHGYTLSDAVCSLVAEEPSAIKADKPVVLDEIEPLVDDIDRVI